MRKIDIQINQAKITGFDIDFNDEGLPDVSATIGLLSGNKQISAFTLSTKQWQDKTFELPISMIEPIKKIAKDLETILIRECSSSMGQLSSGK